MGTCNNPECRKQYVLDDTDDGFCSFECWEKVNCQSPPVPSEEFEMNEVK